MESKTAIIIGAGPAGLTVAEQLLKRTDIRPVVLEADVQVGGISKTVNHKGNRMDFGGHRFFSKSERVMNWWKEKMPPERDEAGIQKIDPEKINRVLLIRQRLSRIFYLRRFFNYPVSLNWHTIRSLGMGRMMRIGFSYIGIRLFPRKQEDNLEDFFINRFGKSLYETFFKDYTEKVWGVPCRDISPEWGGQRIKGLSVSKAVTDALSNMLLSKRQKENREVETSLIRKFYYPKLGPGQMWELVAEEIENLGGEIIMQARAIQVLHNKNAVEAVVYRDANGGLHELQADYVFSTMPMNELFEGMDVPDDLKSIARGLVYRDFITVGLLVNSMKIETKEKPLKDNWIYIQEKDVKLGRLQNFHNWSPYLVKNPEHRWLGLEYFCNEGDDFWNMKDDAIIEFAVNELQSIGIIDESEVVDASMYRVPKAYPAYFGTYNRIDALRLFADSIENLYLIGRNGMHKYNNQDHSMLAAMTAVDNIVNGVKSKDNIWNVNTETAYHESKKI
ncbi:MAG: NAD(P)/FAD-dependent oxidoreductase [Bacteroidota bacterium]